MKPKEKAKELVDKYKPLVTTWDCHWDVRRSEDSITSDAKQCALIAVNEILLGYMSDPKISFWQEVKQEIENL